ncbi:MULTISPECIES: NADH-quinone oxidoreductase subunit C [unclassified Ekhidna]|jgi:NADH-quinone oxidoreductase subunit C|uniref:NADH-quinone oxidoreductase subunit C n=1 Tax=unclassified Ekhidna TaxID=2632188 RepID=UPI0032DE9E40
MQFEGIKSLIEAELPGAVQGEDETSSPRALLIQKDHIVDVCKLLHVNEKTYFDSLSCLTGLDNGEENNTMEVIYNLYSIPFDLRLALKVELDRSNPVIDSVTKIWKTADWLEREAYDLLGINFNGHLDLRRILLPDDWEGHPLRKDYVEQEKYHEVKVKY